MLGAGENGEDLQVVSEHRRHADVQRLQATAASGRDEEDVGGHGAQAAPELFCQVAVMDVHDQHGLLVRGHAGTPHLQADGTSHDPAA